MKGLGRARGRGMLAAWALVAIGLSTGAWAVPTTTDIVRDLGDLPPGKQVRVTFTVTANTPAPPDDRIVSLQGSLVTNNLGNYVSNDPDTPAPGDPTLTSIDRSDSRTTFTLSPSPGLTGQATSLSLQVSPVAPASAAPQGTWRALVDGVEAASGALAADGSATPDLVFHSPGAHLITVEYPGAADYYPSSATLTHTVKALETELAPLTAVNLVGDTHHTTLTVRIDGAAATITQARLTVASGPNAGLAIDGAPNGAAPLGFQYVGSGGFGIDALKVAGRVLYDGREADFATTASKRWVAPELTLTPAYEVNESSDTHDLTASVTLDGQPVGRQFVFFSVTGGIHAGVTGMASTDEAGVAQFSYPGDGQYGTDDLLATATLVVDGLVCPLSATASKEWRRLEFSLSPVMTHLPVGTTHTVVATLTADGGQPRAGRTVNFAVVAGFNTGAAGSAVTDANGQAEFSYAGGPLRGVDLIQASGASSETTRFIPFGAAAIAEWVTVTAQSEYPVFLQETGSTVTGLVTVRINDAPATGVTVHYSVISGPHAGDGGTTRTEDSGAALCEYVGTARGVDTVAATGVVRYLGADYSFATTFDVLWLDIRYELDPLHAVNPIGTTHTVMARMLINDEPVTGGIAMMMVSTGPNAPLSITVPLASTAGTALEYASNGVAGLDELQFMMLAVLIGNPFDHSLYHVLPALGGLGEEDEQVSAHGFGMGPLLFAYREILGTKFWGEAKCALTPARAVNPLGEAHTTTATVTFDGAPASDTRVWFAIADGPNAGTTATAVTDAAGQAAFGWTGLAVGVDEVVCTGGLETTGTILFFDAAAEKRWTEVLCDLTPTTATNPIATTHTVTAVVTVDGAGEGTGPVEFVVVAGPNAGVSGAGWLTDGIATFSYAGLGGHGRDTIATSGGVWVEDALIAFADSAEKRWAKVTSELLPVTAINQIGTTHTIKLVARLDGDQPAAGAAVEFRIVSGPHAGLTTAAITDAAGEAEFAWQGATIGVDVIAAEGALMVDGVAVPFATSAEKEWIDVAARPESELYLQETGATVSGSVFVTLNGMAASSATVNYLVTAGPNAGIGWSGETDEFGESRFRYGGDTRGLDTVTATGQVGYKGSNFAFSTTLDALWLDVSSEFDPLDAVNPVGTTHTVTARLLINDEPVSGAEAMLIVEEGPNSPLEFSQAMLDPDGTPLAYASNGAAGLDRLRFRIGATIIGDPLDHTRYTVSPEFRRLKPVRAPIMPVRQEATGTKFWGEAKCALAPERAVNPLGEAHTTTATVTFDGAPASDTRVWFAIADGPNAGTTATAVTDAAGQAAFGWTGLAIGVDEVVCTGGLETTGTILYFDAAAEKRWTEVLCDLTPSTATNPVETTHTVTAVVTVDGTGEGTGPVEFMVVAGPNTGVSGAGWLEDGVAEFAYQGLGGHGRDTIAVSGGVWVEDALIAFADSAEKRWAEVTAELLPVTAINQLGTTHTVRLVARLDGDQPAAGAAVEFRIVSGPHAGLTAAAVADAAGEALFAYVGESAGLDAIVAEGALMVDGVAIPFAASAEKEWVNVRLDILPESATGQIGRLHRVAGMLTVNGAPREGEAMVFEIVEGPNAGLRRTLVTNHLGRATLEYRGAELGTDVVRIGGDTVLDGATIPFEAQARRLWIDLALRLTPALGQAWRGQGHVVDLSLSLDGAPVGGQQIEIGVAEGPNAGVSQLLTTDASGAATFAYATGASTGVDVIRATGTRLVNGDAIGFESAAIAAIEALIWPLSTNATHGEVQRAPDAPAYEDGTIVSLTANPDPDYEFVAWAGDVPAGQEGVNPLAVTMDTTRTITAEFRRMAPEAPSSPSPADGAVDVFIGADLGWRAAERTDEYAVWLWRADQPKPDDALTTVTGDGWNIPFDLDYATSYTWQVVAINETGETAGPEWGFVTAPFVQVTEALILDYLLGRISLTPVEKAACDLNGDGIVDVGDLNVQNQGGGGPSPAAALPRRR